MVFFSLVKFNELKWLAGPWTTMDSEFGYDYWYQPTHDVLISSEWGCPTAFFKGFDPKDVAAGKFLVLAILVVDGCNEKCIY